MPKLREKDANQLQLEKDIEAIKEFEGALLSRTSLCYVVSRSKFTERCLGTVHAQSSDTRYIGPRVETY